MRIFTFRFPKVFFLSQTSNKYLGNKYLDFRN